MRAKVRLVHDRKPTVAKHVPTRRVPRTCGTLVRNTGVTSGFDFKRHMTGVVEMMAMIACLRVGPDQRSNHQHERHRCSQKTPNDAIS